MDEVPAYLLWYLLKIRGHSGERGYLLGRAKSLDVKVATYEAGMLREMSDLHLVGLADEQDVSFLDESGEPCTIPIPGTFVILARGHYAWVEPRLRGFRWLAAALLGALIATVISA